MVWICEVCNGKNNNSSIKCRVQQCHAPKPQSVIDAEINKRIVRDYCPVCKVHQYFYRIKGKSYACQKCHKRFKFKGKPVPEVMQVE